jgi:hypothetical protein
VKRIVNQRRIADLLMPAGNWQLRSQNRGPHPVTVLGDLPEVAALGFTQRCHGPIVDHQTSMRLSRASRVRRLPSARAIARSRNSD